MLPKVRRRTALAVLVRSFVTVEKPENDWKKFGYVQNVLVVQFGVAGFRSCDSFAFGAGFPSLGRYDEFPAR